MRFQQPESTGPAAGSAGPEKPYKSYYVDSPSFPFGQSVPLKEIGGPTYVTAQTLVQQVAYTLSDRLWTYSPDTFHLDSAVQRWKDEGAENAYGYATGVQAMQIRSGAASIALGYIFSKDFDLKKRHIPQSIIATSSSLQYLRTALDQLSLLYSVANPFVAHVAAVDYTGGASPGLVTDYVSGLALAEELGMGVVSSFSAHESQHMSLLATLFASAFPTMHLYDGISVGRETTRVIDVLDQGGLHRNYKAIQEEATKSIRKHADNDTKAVELLKAFNGELGTDYRLFEYRGHDEPEAVLVVFGTVESSLSSQVAQSLQANGAKIGVISVRVYRPFVEDEFMKAVPKSAKLVGVLGQIENNQAVSDQGIQSNLYKDVLAAITFSSDRQTPPDVMDIKYPRTQAWKPVSIATAFQLLVSKPLLGAPTDGETETTNESLQIVDPTTTQQYTFWDLDDTVTRKAPLILGEALSKESASNVTVSTKFNNLLQGGIHRIDIRKSKKSLEATYPIDSADAIYIGNIDVLKAVNVLSSLKAGGKALVNLSGVKDDEIEKKLPVAFRAGLAEKGVKLYILDPAAVEDLDENDDVHSYLVQVAFLRVAMPSLEDVGAPKLASLNGNTDIFEKLSGALEQALRVVEVPEEWTDVDEEAELPKLPGDIYTSSFIPFDKTEPEPPTLLKNWQTIAKGLAFKEAYGANLSLKPELTTQTWKVRLMEHRRLTPVTYDRNIMHLEFDLGDSGMKYNIGDSLGIHPRNDTQDVEAFIQSYGLDADAVVEAEHKDGALRARTVYQALIEDVDIFGQPGRQFYEQLASFATSPVEAKQLLALGGGEGATEFKRRAEVDTITYADILEEFPSAHPEIHDIIRLVAPLKRREYSIASCQRVTPNTVSLMIVTVNWVDPRGRDRFGLATRYLDALRPGDAVTVSLKPSVMKLPPKPTDPLIMAGLGTGLAPFRAFVQHRAWEKAQGIDIGPVLLYMGSRYQREEYCYGEEWEAYRDAGVVSLLSCAFSRDQPQKIYIQDRMRQTSSDIEEAYINQPGAFYLCGPTWPVPDVTNVLEDVIGAKAKKEGKKVKPRTEIEKLKDEGRYVLEVY